MEELLTIALGAGSVAAVGASLRDIQSNARSVHAAVAVNYAVGALLAGIYWCARGGDAQWGLVLLIGGCTGLFYAGALHAIVRNMGQRGMALTMALTNLSVVAVVLLALFLGERPTNPQYVGLATAALAIPFISLSTVTGKAIRQSPSAPWLLTLFVMQAGALSGNVVATRFLPSESIPAYIVVLFASACVYSTLAWWLDGEPSRRGDWLRGAGFGVVNIGTTLVILFGLARMPGSVFLPSRSVLGLSLSAAVAVLLWRERLHARGWIGFALALVATLLLNLPAVP
jgi:drug/metabolite transporter (DMT)-like permease